MQSPHTGQYCEVQKIWCERAAVKGAVVRNKQGNERAGDEVTAYSAECFAWFDRFRRRRYVYYGMPTLTIPIIVSQLLELARQLSPDERRALLNRFGLSGSIRCYRSRMGGEGRSRN